MGKRKIVVDTNTLISALGWGGHPQEVIEKVIIQEVIMYWSKEIKDELIRVMNYPKFEFTPEEKTKFLSILTAIAIFVEPEKKVQAVQEDLSDNIFLECALEAGADFVITGDKHLLKLKEFEGIQIVKPFDFLINNTSMGEGNVSEESGQTH